MTKKALVGTQAYSEVLHGFSISLQVSSWN